MFSAELKACTGVVHAELEKKLVARIKKIASPADYFDLLQLMYGFYHPLQQQLQSSLAVHPKISDRGQWSERILADMVKLDGAAKEPLRMCTELPATRSEASCLGVLYVLEGSTLGGQIITRMIARQLHIDSAEGFTFFNAYGDDTPLMWERFRHLLDQPRSDEEKATIRDAATNTFSSFKNWIDEYESAAHQ